MYARLLVVIAALALLVAPAAARADATPAPTPDQILRSLAADQTHSWVQDGIGFDAMEAEYKAGQRLYVTCGNVAEVARRLLREAGYPARVVQTITLGDFDEMNDGHLMTEVFYDGRWQLYDIDANARAVDADGNGVSLVDQVAAVQAGTAHWEQIAADPLYRTDEPDPTLRALAEKIFDDPAAFYLHVMGIPLLPRDPAGTVALGMYFHDASQIDRLAHYHHGWRFFATDAQWQQLTTSPDAPPLPAPPAPPAPKPAPPRPAPAPTRPAAPAATPAPAPTPAPVAKHAPSCSVAGHAVERHGRVTCGRAQQVLKRYVDRRHAPSGWRCHGRRTVTCAHAAAWVRVTGVRL